MRRRAFIAGLGGATAWPWAARERSPLPVFLVPRQYRKRLRSRRSLRLTRVMWCRTVRCVSDEEQTPNCSNRPRHRRSKRCMCPRGDERSGCDNDQLAVKVA